MLFKCSAQVSRGCLGDVEIFHFLIKDSICEDFPIVGECASESQILPAIPGLYLYNAKHLTWQKWC